MHGTKLNEKRGMNLKKSKAGYMEGGKERKKQCNYNLKNIQNPLALWLEDMAQQQSTCLPYMRPTKET